MTVLDPEAITVGARLRSLSDAQVEALVQSIAEVGVLHPITVHATRVVRDGQMVDGHELVAGAHRLEACKRLGLAEIPVHLVELDDLHRQIAECDENLCGTKLTPAEKAMFTKRRKQAYEALHPETRHGGDRKGDQVADSATCSYADDQAAKTGEAPRTIREHATRGEQIEPKALELVRGTHLDRGTYLDELRKVDASEQARRVRDDLERSKPKPAAVKTVIDVQDAQFKALLNAWNKAGAEVRQAFLEHIDTPVIDQARGYA